MQSHLAEPFYQEWFNKHLEIKLTTAYPLLPFFENLKNIQKFFLWRTYEKLFSVFIKNISVQCFHLEIPIFL